MIRRLLKTIINIVTTAFHTATSLGLIAAFSASRQRIPRSAKPDDACVILGNGPSLKESLAKHAATFQGKTCICVNDFAEIPSFTTLQPAHYVMTDPTYWSKNAAAHFQESFRRYSSLLASQVTWPLTIYLPVAARQWNYFQNLPAQNANIRLHYLNTTEVNCFRSLRFFLYRKELAIPIMQNVLIAGLYIALNAGFKTIYLVGADHSWHESLYVDEKNRLYLKNDRVQDAAAQQLSPFFIDPGHTIPYTMHKLLHDFSRMYAGYEEMESYARSLGAKIYNASEKSYIDAFERKKLTTL